MEFDNEHENIKGTLIIFADSLFEEYLTQNKIFPHSKVFFIIK
jgi:hypothetical protein